MIKKIFTLALPILAIGLAWSRGDDSDPIARLQSKLDSVESLRGRFVQTLDSPGLGRTRTERGEFALKKPSLMRWQYSSPEQKLAIVDGTHTWLYVPGDNEVQRGSVDDLGGDASAIGLLSGRMRLDRDFTSRRLIGEELEAAGPQGVAGAIVYELRPLEGGEDFQKLIIAVEPESLVIRRISVTDSVGGTMAFDFYDLHENPDLPAGFFEFHPPAGVEVIDIR